MDSQPETKGRYAVEQAYHISMEFTNIYNTTCNKQIALTRLARWYDKVETLSLKFFKSLIDTIQNDYGIICNYFDNRSTNASAESFNAKVKAFRSLDKMFSYSKIDYQLNQNMKNQHIEQNQPHVSQNSVGSTIESIGSALGGLLDIQPGNSYDENEAEFQRLIRKKKLKRKFGRQM